MDSQVQKQLMLLEEALGSSNRKLEHQDNIDRVVKTLNFEKADRTDLIQMRKDNDEKFATIKDLEKHICEFKALESKQIGDDAAIHMNLNQHI